MKHHGIRILVGGVAALCLAGCASTVTIHRPVDRTSVAQITDFFEVSFDTATEPNFAATVNGSVPPPPREFKFKSRQATAARPTKRRTESTTSVPAFTA